MDQSKARAGLCRKPRTRLAPCLESLEGRRLLAASATQVTISEGLSQGTPTLLILGTKGSESISITDNGTGSAGNVTVTLGNGSTYTTKTAVAEVEVASGNGNDQVSYTLTGPLVTPRTVLTYLGNGKNDSFVANVNGAIENTQGLDIETYGGAGHDTMTINQSGPVLEGTFIPFLQGGRGSAVMTYNGTGPINGNATINPAFSGGMGDNTIVSNYSGTIDGKYIYNMSILGGRRNDKITDNIHVGPGSVGSVGTSSTQPAVIKAGPGRNQIHYAITVDPAATQATINAAIIGGSRLTTVERTANVVNAMGHGKDSIIPS